MGYIRKLKPKDMKRLCEMMTPEKFLFASTKFNVPVEYEQDQDLLYFSTIEEKKNFTFVFSEHGLVNIFRKDKNGLDEPMHTTNSEYGCFETSGECLPLTKLFIGFMASLFKEEYLQSEFDRRIFLASLFENAKIQSEFDYSWSEKELEKISNDLDSISTDPRLDYNYSFGIIDYINKQYESNTNDDRVQEYTNHYTYHTSVAEYIDEIARDIFRYDVKNKQKLGDPTIAEIVASIKPLDCDFKDLPEHYC